MKAIFIVFITLLCNVSISFAQLNLDECQQLARENYPLIKQFDLIEKSKELNLSNAAKAYLPQFSISAMANLVEGMPEISAPGTSSGSSHHQFVGIANLKQSIWDGGATRAQKKIIEAQSEVEKQNIETLLYGIKERVNQLYFGILLIDEQVKQLDILDVNLQQNMKRAETAYTNGIAFQSDLDAVKVEMLNSEQSRINLLAQRGVYTDVLSIMINKTISIDTKFLPPADVTFAANQEINRPELRLYEQQRLLNNAQNMAITSRNMPKIGLTGYAIGLTPGISLGSSKMNRLLMAGVSLSWNIGGLYTKNNDHDIIRTNNLMINTQQETFLFNTNLELKQSEKQIERSKLLMQKDDEIIELRERIKKSSETKYENGVCTMTDLIRDINTENMARLNKALHYIEYLNNVYTHKTSLN